jgi:hypothetical protein
MSGWGCRYQVDDPCLLQCLLLRKECKPGIPGCVLYKKVCFIADVEQPPLSTPRASFRRRAPTKPASSKKR